jgi:hypothetical protein
MTFDEGRWREWKSPEGGGFVMRVGMIFACEVSFREDTWAAMLNGQYMGGYGCSEHARARLDWEVWNRMRLAEKGLARIVERESAWRTGWQ